MPECGTKSSHQGHTSVTMCLQNHTWREILTRDGIKLLRREVGRCDSAQTDRCGRGS